ncbi:hypothetical protein RvY_14532 [Ramazzottius varieornatus]|uniref:Uncharacterized protein n=1 Tax=Ramazzottius varieornatus TaxID=947166 RepID=A0A1D1VRR7_RAMVA|nr:hypothetical protein RvY_14532 [Ramazzottius varieornatus]
MSDDSGDEADVSNLSVSFISSSDTEETSATDEISNDLKFFKTGAGVASVLDRLRDIEVAETYANATMPIKFQGSAMAAVQL